jgi:uncharacterized RDD family membrane protein YckC
MNWYYVNQGQQAGPVTQEELLALVREGKISEETLVWREGMQGWTAFHQAGISTEPLYTPAPPVPPPANPNESVCAECGQIFPNDEMIQHGNVRVCAACKPVFLQKLAEGAKINVSTSGDLQYAGFWIRLGAWLLDTIILGIPYLAVSFVIGILTGSRRLDPGQPPLLIGPFLVIFLQFAIIAVHIGYWTYFIGKYGATPGKMACRLKVVSASGSRITYGLAAGRALSQMLSAMICYIGFLMAPFDVQKRALHDHICNTRVVYK